MFRSYLRKILFGSASLTLLSSAFFFCPAFGRQEAAPKAAETKPASDPVKPEDKPAETKIVDPSIATEKKDAEKKEEKAKAAKEKLPPKKQLRQISLSGSYDDLMQPASLDPTSLLMGQSPAKSKSFFRLLEYIHEMADDENVTHVLFDLSDSSMGFNSAQLDELTRHLAVLKAKSKKKERVPNKVRPMSLIAAATKKACNVLKSCLMVNINFATK
jgi:hypothetical protein